MSIASDIGATTFARFGIQAVVSIAATSKAAEGKNDCCLCCRLAMG